MLLNLLFTLSAHADDGVVNLDDLGTSGFTPYLTERHDIWIALPALAIIVLLVHLQRTRKKRKSGGNA